MTISRRSILRALPAIPFVTKKAAQEAQAQLAGVAPNVGAGRIYDPLAHPMSEFHARQLSRVEQFFKFFSKNGLPQWKLDELKRRARDVNHIDPDIAALQSVSLGAKMRMQTARNEKKLIGDEVSSLERRLTRGNWLKEFGVDEY